MKWVLLAAAVGVGVLVAIEMPQLVRYIKIERM